LEISPATGYQKIQLEELNQQATDQVVARRILPIEPESVAMID